MNKIELKARAMKLRFSGKSYKEIKEALGTPKSTLSYWFRDLSISTELRESLQEKKHKGAALGALVRHQNRIIRTRKIVETSKSEVGEINLDKLFLIGIALYWAEGSKQKAHNVSERVIFSCSDSKMIRIFLLWLDKICHIKQERLIFELYIHESAAIEKAQEYWRIQLGLAGVDILVRKKRHTITNRKNTASRYHGQMRIVVRRSTDLNRRIAGWIQAVSEKCEIY